MERLIHIHAKCNHFEIFEMVAEKKSVKRLGKIKEMFLWGQSHTNKVLPKSKKGKVHYNWLVPKIMDSENKLSVKTGVVNPELPFINLY